MSSSAFSLQRQPPSLISKDAGEEVTASKSRSLQSSLFLFATIEVRFVKVCREGDKKFDGSLVI